MVARRSAITLAGIGVLMAVLLPAVSASAAPPNDDFNNASVIALLPFLDHTSLDSATGAGDDPTACLAFGQALRSVWYSFTTQRNMKVEALSDGSQTAISVFTGSRGALTEIACDRSELDVARGGASGPDSKVTFNATAGAQYFVMIDSISVFGDLVFRLNDASKAAPNDDISNATPITGSTFTDTIDVSATTATPAEQDTCLGGPIFSNTVWYSLTPTRDSTVDIRSQFTPEFRGYSSYDIRVCVVGIRANPGFVQFDAIAGTTYTIEVARDLDSRTDGNVLDLLVTTTPGRHLGALAPAKAWVGLKNSDDVGLRVDLLAEVLKNAAVVSSGHLDGVVTGSSGFNNAKLATIPVGAIVPADYLPGNNLSLRLSVRNACVGPSHNSGTVRLWFNDAAANSQIEVTLDGTPHTLYLSSSASGRLGLSTTVGFGPMKFIDVAAGARCSAFKQFGLWRITTISIP